MATLLDALSQENLDNQREVVKNEKRWSYDNRPYGSWQEKLQAPPVPAGAPVPPLDDRLDGRPRRGVARGRQRVLPDLLRAEQRGPVDRRRRRDGRGRRAAPSGTSGRSRPTRPSRRSGDLSLPPTLGGERRETVRDRVPLPRVHVGFRAPVVRRPAARCARPGRPDPGGRQGQPARSPAGPRRADRPGRRDLHARVHRRRVGHGRLGDGPAGRLGRRASRRRSIEELERLATELVSDDELARAKALIEADELGALQRVEERADRLSMYATLFDDPGLINRMLPRYLAVTPEAIRDVAAAVFRPDNRLVLTYLPEGSSADDVALSDDEADDRGRRGGGMSTTTDPRPDGPVLADRPEPGRAARLRVPGGHRPDPGQRRCRSWSRTCPGARWSRPR